MTRTRFIFLREEKNPTSRNDFDDLVDQKCCSVSEEPLQSFFVLLTLRLFHPVITALIFPIIENIYFSP